MNNSSNPFNIIEQPHIAQEVTKLNHHQHWWLRNSQHQDIGLLDTKTGALYTPNANPISLAQTWQEQSKKHRFWWLGGKSNDVLFNSKTQLLWSLVSITHEMTLEQANDKLKAHQKPNLNYWELPSKARLKAFAMEPKNPWRDSRVEDRNSSLGDLLGLNKYRLLNHSNWLCDEGRINLDNWQSDEIRVDSSGSGLIVGLNSVFDGLDDTALLSWLGEQNTFLIAESGEDFKIQPKVQQHVAKDKLVTQVETWLQQGYTLTAADGSTSLNPFSIIDHFRDIDYRSVRLPKLEDAQFTDVNKGIWEFWGMDEALLKQAKVNARNPELDVKKFNVAIDFGTSSTVVALDNNGKTELLRVGVKDFNEAPKPSHYENPTVLQFNDYQQLLAAWQSTPYRPNVTWDSLCAAHEAQNNFRYNQGNANVVASILPKMKQWALRQSQDMRLKIIDRQGIEFELPPLKPTNPVKGQLLTVSQNDPFDPIELYAWFLGMNINWRARGLFVKYYMTFPVDYPKEIKESILASFRRGLHRSMPEPFARSDKFQRQFSLKELATEPAAYAASALDMFNIQPTAEGVAYAVFDFGGGTTDFDYGYYRTASTEEEDMGIERVLAHIGKQGDKFLGGENLLENLAYLVFVQNIELCRSNKIAFTCPLDAKPLPGTELLIDKTNAAQTNSILLMAKLRSFWETGTYKAATGGIENIDLLNRDGQKVPCELKIDAKLLDAFLTERIEKGIISFFLGIKEAFGQTLPSSIHILLAGNSSRSKWVKDYFASEAYTQMIATQFTQTPPEFIIHDPLPVDEKEPFKPTAKTGVALGLLQLCRGDLVQVNKVQETPGQAAFNHFVGRIKLGKFQHTLKRNDGYNQWHELAPITQEATVYLYHTQSVQALSGEMKREDSELHQIRIDFAGDVSGQRAFVRAIDPNTIELCSAINKETLDKGDYENVQTYKLD